jgi:hypothetical protein
MTARINARISAELARKVQYLRGRTGKSATQVVAASIEEYFDRVAHQQGPAQLLGEFVGCAAGPRNLSSNYKRSIASSLRRKHRV